MDFTEYQKRSRKTAMYPNIGKNFIYPALGLAGESGEVIEIIKKSLRDNDGKLTDENIDYLERELGDVLWYLAAIASEFKLDFGKVAKRNIEKLEKRLKENKIHGSGDDR